MWAIGTHLNRLSEEFREHEVFCLWLVRAYLNRLPSGQDEQKSWPAASMFQLWEGRAYKQGMPKQSIGFSG